MFVRRQIWECEIQASLRKTGKLFSKDFVANAAAAFVVTSWREGPHSRSLSMKIDGMHNKAAPVNAPVTPRFHAGRTLLRDVGEDMYGKFHFDGIAEVPDMDSAITELHVHVLATRHLGAVTSYLKKFLRRHALSEHAQISRLDHADSRA